MSHKLYNAVREVNGKNGYVITVLFDKMGSCLENFESLGIFISDDEQKYSYFLKDEKVSREKLLDVLGVQKFEQALVYAERYEILEEILLEAMEIEAEDYDGKVDFDQIRKEIRESARLSWYLVTHNYKHNSSNADPRYNVM